MAAVSWLIRASWPETFCSGPRKQVQKEAYDASGCKRGPDTVMGKIILAIILGIFLLCVADGILGVFFGFFGGLIGLIVGLVGAAIGLVVGIFGALLGAFAGLTVLAAPLLILALIVLGIVQVLKALG